MSILKHSILSLATLVIISFPGFALLMRNTIVTVLNEDYVLQAKAKGLSANTVRKSYVNKNAILPVSTSAGLAFAGIVGCTFIVEEVFHTLASVTYFTMGSRSTIIPLKEGIFLIIVIVAIFAKFVVDLLYAYLDPRVVLKWQM
ncbi:MAG: ABC transporter permease [Candidatus Parvarchaeota archaeon]